jgi:hypothetical protein
MTLLQLPGARGGHREAGEKGGGIKYLLLLPLPPDIKGAKRKAERKVTVLEP